MTRAPSFLLLPLLAIAACQTVRKPLTGFDTPPPGIVLDPTTGPTLLLWPIFALPQSPLQTFQPRLNGQDTIIVTSDEGFYDYDRLQLEGWTGGVNSWLNGVPSGTYVVELVDDTGQSWGRSPPLAVPALSPSTFGSASGQLPAVVFTHFGGQAGSWTIDPSTQDSDPSTDEITVTNLVDEDVAVERCQITNAGRASCSLVGTVAPQADLLTVETLVLSTAADHQALFVHLASDANQAYQRDLVEGSGMFGSSCQVERILVHGMTPTPVDNPINSTAFAMSTCYGYGSGAN